MNTRFNPTVNGKLHVGHLYLILLNHHAARSTGGKFVIRFDDDQNHWNNFLGVEKMDEFAQKIKEDMEWLDLVPDMYSSERESRELNEKFIKLCLPRSQLILEDRVTPEPRYQPKVSSCAWPYPHTPYLTAVKVAQDFREGINLLIRGEDLIDEFSLYCFFCVTSGVPLPAFQYLPRMQKGGAFYGAEPGELIDATKTGTALSKTTGGYQIDEYRQAGWTPKALIEMLAESTLNDPSEGWVYGNVKKTPIIRKPA